MFDAANEAGADGVSKDGAKGTGAGGGHPSYHLISAPSSALLASSC